ncbi:MAG TPA: cytochrome c biogenesis protein ResB [Paenibacillaceae bacterium]|nr:cytochrome c biogenesis protein ResB [Paenibacillaceae bacterium]
MENVKCECGHVNSVGTMLCESCGVPLSEESANQLDMRYEGASRRSQLKKRSFIDDIWSFFSSVKNAIIMIVLALIASAIGTVFPQETMIAESPAVYYEKAYGIFGKIYYVLGLHHTYSSWWFITLLLMIGVSLVICSLDRIVPLYRALKNQKVKKNRKFLQLQRIRAQLSLAGKDENDAINELEKKLAAKGYKVRREGNAILGEKGRFSRWGPYINHIGLIIFIIGVLMSNIPGFYLDKYVWVRDGQTIEVPGTKYYVKNEKFIMEFYQDDEYPEKLDLNGEVVKSYTTKAVLYENKNYGITGAEPKLVEVKKQDVLVNHPLKYKELGLYQSGQQPNQLGALNLGLVEKSTGKELGHLKLDLYNPPASIKINDQVTVKVLQYYPNFAIDDKGQPITKSNEPINPVFFLDVVSPATPKGETAVVLLGQMLNPGNDNPLYQFNFEKPDLINITGLTVRVDERLPVIYFGSIIVILGLVMGFYWQHRRIWLDVQEGQLFMAAYTNKNWFGLKQETARILQEAGFSIESGQLEKEG